MKSLLTATAILLATSAPPALAQSANAPAGNSTGNGAGTASTSSGGQYTGGGIAGTAATVNNSQKSPDYDSTAAKRRNSINGGQASSPTARTMSQGPNGTPRMQEGPGDSNNSQGSYQPKTPP